MSMLWILVYMYSILKHSLLALGFCLSGLSCSQDHPPANTTSVRQLDLNRYMGTWYEIARLPNRFEAGLVNVKATYRMLEKGRVHVLNQGQQQQSGDASEATGRAYRPDSQMGGHLRVTFVPPYCWFYGSYNVLYISDDYQLAVVSGSDSQLLWFLSRQSSITAEQQDRLLSLAKERGFDTSKLIWTPQNVDFAKS